MRPDVAIVGGGVIGWSAAFHLMRLVPSLSVVVIDKYSRGGMGSTSLAAGGVRAQFSTPVNILLSKESIEFFERFEEETGEDPSFRQHGYLFVASTKRGAAYLASCVALQLSLGVEVDTVNPVLTIGILQTSDLLAASFAPKDGYLDPYAVCRGFEGAARKAGATAIYNTRVLGGDLATVRTEHGPLECGAVLLCPGHWSAGVGDGFGIEIPVQHTRHMLTLTGPVPGLLSNLPMVVDLETSFHFRPEGEGLLVGCNWDCPTPPDPNEPALFDFGFLQAIAQHGMHRLPMLNKVGFDTKRSWAGYYAETPDRHAIIGKVGGVFLATGFGGHGIMHSPAAGRAIAQLMMTGASDLDISTLRPSRFAEGDWVVENMVI
ncbi:MAG: FAD-binding oxidoreductase [Armatimonadota bacterium]|nr:FAD-binding oxidoreductase [Armatimonadota bacterium]